MNLELSYSIINFILSGLIMTFLVTLATKQTSWKTQIVRLAGYTVLNLVVSYAVFAKICASSIPSFRWIMTLPWDYVTYGLAFGAEDYWIPYVTASVLVLVILWKKSVVTFQFSVEKVEKIKKSRVILWIILFLIANLVLLEKFAIHWSFETFGQIPFEEVIFNITTPLENANENAVVVDFMTKYLKWMMPFLIAYAVIILIRIIFMHRYVMVKQTTKRKVRFVPLEKYFRIFLIVWSVVTTLIALCSAGVLFSMGSYVYNMTHKTKIYDEYYVDPADAEITFPENKRNVILIYCESMEISYADAAAGGGYKKNLIPNLTKLALGNECFGDGKTLNGGLETTNVTWTMGSMVAQTAGIPLTVPFGQNSYGRYSNFLPGVTNLGDILEKEGYEQYVMMGSSATFAGYDTYLKTHGNFAIHDYNYAKENKMIPEDYNVNWGFEDEKVFEFAKKELTEIAKDGKPFNYSIQTLDTHFPDGYVSDDSPHLYSWSMENAIYCTDLFMNDFIEWVKQQDFYENTTVVITGDHYNMSKKIPGKLTEGYQRKTLTIVLNSAAEKERWDVRTFASIDMFPTVLAAMGCKIEGDRLGLGTNLYGSRDTLIEELGLDAVNEELGRKSNYYDQFLYGKN